MMLSVHPLRQAVRASPRVAGLSSAMAKAGNKMATATSDREAKLMASHYNTGSSKRQAKNLVQATSCRPLPIVRHASDHFEDPS